MRTKNEKILITGSLGLIGFEAVNFFVKKGYSVIGIDNDMRAKLFNIKTQYETKLKYLNKNYQYRYKHYQYDIRDREKLIPIFKKNGVDIKLIIHTAAQTSHDWSAKNPSVDFSINALSSFYLLELYRHYLPEAVFIYTSTNKVYGDLVNNFKFKEHQTRYDLEEINPYFYGIKEDFSIDHSVHSPFGISKASADLLTQEYGKYFNLKTGVFRLGVVTGSGQSGALDQGFLSYIAKNIINEKHFSILGYKGKQVRDIIHAKDIIKAFYLFYKNPKKGEVFNLGGGRQNSTSVIELISQIVKITGKKPKMSYIPQVRKGVHMWLISDSSKFKKNFFNWKIKYSLENIIFDILQNNK